MTSFSLSKNKLLVVFSMQCTQDKKYHFSSSACLYLYRDPMHTVENLKLLLNNSILRKLYPIVIFKRALPFLRNSKGFWPKRHLPLLCTYFEQKRVFCHSVQCPRKNYSSLPQPHLGVSEHSFCKKAVYVTQSKDWKVFMMHPHSSLILFVKTKPAYCYSLSQCWKIIQKVAFNPFYNLKQGKCQCFVYKMGTVLVKVSCWMKEFWQIKT